LGRALRIQTRKVAYNQWCIGAGDAGDAVASPRSIFKENLGKFGKHLGKMWANLDKLGKIWEKFD